jgi:hypothetical protein
LQHSFHLSPFRILLFWRCRSSTLLETVLVCLSRFITTIDLHFFLFSFLPLFSWLLHYDRKNTSAAKRVCSLVVIRASITYHKKCFCVWE